MILPRKKFYDRQRFLWEPPPRPIRSDGELRWAVGDFYEEPTARVSGASRLRTDSRATICPDLQYSDRLFFESKAVGKTGKVILYGGRIEKYSEFCTAEYTLLHWIWSHNYRASSSATFPELFQNLENHTRELFIVDFPTLQDFCTAAPQTLINSQYAKRQNRGGSGYHQNETYGTGWMVPLHRIRQMLFRLDRPTVNGAAVYVGKTQFEEYL